MNKEELLQDFYGKVPELSSLINSWNLIAGSNKSSFDELSEKILHNLYEDKEELKIQRILESEFCVRYGLYRTEFNAGKLTDEIMEWWNKEF